MIIFFEKTWALGWMLAVVVILYRFDKWSANTDPETLNAPVSGEEVRTVPGQSPARKTTPPFVDGTWF